jgi:protein TonB
MKTKLRLVLLVGFLFSLIAGQAQEVVNGKAKPTEENADSNKIFLEVTDPAQFPGGDPARIKYFIENIKYPKEALDSNKQGTVYISFVIEADGSIRNVRVLRGVCTSIDAEAVRVVEAMPRWEPGKVDDKAVRSQFNMPIRFSIPITSDDTTPATDSKKKKKKHHKKPKAKDAKKSSSAKQDVILETK